MFGIGPTGSGRNSVESDDETDDSEGGSDGDDGCNVRIASAMATIILTGDQRTSIMNEQRNRQTIRQ